MSPYNETVELGLGQTGLDDTCTGCGQRDGCDGCRGGECHTCVSGVSERPRWFAGQLVGPADLESMQQWVIGRARRHNRMLHGWGVSCGLTVAPTTSPSTKDKVPWSLTVGPGYGLTACGDEISVDCPVKIDVRMPHPSADDVCAPPQDPWCAPVRQRRDPERTYFLAIRYSEGLDRPVRAGACGCGCDDACEYSRVSEGFSLAILDELPECHDVTAFGHRGRELPVGAANSALDRHEAQACSERIARIGSRPCPSCCSPWLVLADIQIDANGGITIDALTHRRFLMSLGAVGFTCTPIRDGNKPRLLSNIEREAIKKAFATAESAQADKPDASEILSAPATALRGAKANSALRELLRNRSVHELADADIDALEAEAKGAGADITLLRHLHEAALLVVRIVHP
jgi:hypothetical protein